jgi:hypothetical protein
MFSIESICEDKIRLKRAQHGASSQVFLHVACIGIQTFECLNFNFKASILVFSSIAAFEVYAESNSLKRCYFNGP